MSRIIIFCLLFCSFHLFAQRLPTGFPSSGSFGGSGSTTTPTASTDTDEDLDTVKVAYFFAFQPSKKIPFSDTLLTNNFQQYSPLRTRRAEYASLGANGMAHKPILWESKIREGFDAGIHSFDLYQIENQNIRYYQTSKPFSEAKWTVRTITGDSNFDFDYGGQFANNNYASLEWHRSNQSNYTSSKSSYKFQNISARNTNWAFGMAHLGNKYTCFVSMATNNYEQTNNGGITTDTSMLQSNFFGNFTVPVRLARELNLRYRTQNMQYKHSYQFTQKRDSLSNKRNFLILHTFDYQTITNKNYYNTSTDSKLDTTFFKSYINESRGMRIYFDIKKIENQVSIATQKPRAGQIPDVIEIGLKHRFYNINFEPLDTQIHHIFAFAKWNFALSKWLKINTYGHFGLLPANAAEYCAKGDFQLNLQKLGLLEGSFTQQRYQPTFMQTNMYNFQQKVYQYNNFDKIFATSLTAAYRIPKLNFAVSGAYHLLNNYIYFGENLLPIQNKSAINLLQLEVMQDFHFWKIHSENYIALQKSTNEAIHLPALYGKHGLYIEGKIFRKGAMLARLGADFRYATDYKADAYHPLINQFYTQSSTTIPFFPALDAYFSARVLKLRAFVKVENITSSFYKKSVFYTVPNYPMYGTYLRIGFYRRFTD